MPDCFPPQGFALALPSARNTFLSNCHITGCFLLFRSQLRCHLPKEVTIHSIKVALPPPRAACHFSSSYCPGPFSPWLPPLPELISLMYLITFSLSVFHQYRIWSPAILLPTFSPVLETMPDTLEGLGSQPNSALDFILLLGSLVSVTVNFTQQLG